MEYNEICGKRQLEFMKQFDYIREAGTDGEEKAALEIQRELKSFGVDSRLEEFEIDTWRILSGKPEPMVKKRPPWRSRGSLRALAWTAAWKNLRSIRGGSLKLNSL